MKLRYGNGFSVRRAGTWNLPELACRHARHKGASIIRLSEDIAQYGFLPGKKELLTVKSPDRKSSPPVFRQAAICASLQIVNPDLCLSEIVMIGDFLAVRREVG